MRGALVRRAAGARRVRCASRETPRALGRGAGLIVASYCIRRRGGGVSTQSGYGAIRSDGSVMENKAGERHSVPADPMVNRSFDEMAKGFAAGTTSRDQVLKGFVGALLGSGLLALVPGVAGAKGHRGGGDGKGGKYHGGGGGSNVCPPTCPRGSVTVAPTAQG